MKILLCLLLACAAASAEETAAPARAMSVGVNYLGGQLDYDFGAGHRLEARYVSGKDSSSEGTINSAAVGLRAAQRFRLNGVYHPYLGAEADYISARTAGGVYNVHGLAAGLFVGVERSLWKRLSIGFDLGPYVFLLNERTTNTSNTSFDAVANGYVLFRLF